MLGRVDPRVIHQRLQSLDGSLVRLKECHCERSPHRVNRCSDQVEPLRPANFSRLRSLCREIRRVKEKRGEEPKQGCVAQAPHSPDQRPISQLSH